MGSSSQSSLWLSGAAGLRTLPRRRGPVRLAAERVRSVRIAARSAKAAKPQTPDDALRVQGKRGSMSVG